MKKIFFTVGLLFVYNTSYAIDQEKSDRIKAVTAGVVAGIIGETYHHSSRPYYGIQDKSIAYMFAYSAVGNVILYGMLEKPHYSHIILSTAGGMCAKYSVAAVVEGYRNPVSLLITVPAVLVTSMLTYKVFQNSDAKVAATVGAVDSKK